MSRPLRIGLTARLMYPDPARTVLPTKVVHYAEENAANVYQSIDSSANDYVTIALTSNETISGPVSIRVVTITIAGLHGKESC